MIEYIGIGIVILGSLLIFTGALGVFKMVEFLPKLHASGVGESAGSLVVSLGLALQADNILVAVKLLCLGIFVSVTAAIAAHLLANYYHEDAK